MKKKTKSLQPTRRGEGKKEEEEEEEEEPGRRRHD